MRAQLIFLIALIATNLKAAFALRGAFWVQVGFMMVNNLIFFVMWWIFFWRFEEVRGWRIEDMTLLYGMAAGAFGLMATFGAGARELSQTILDGGLDSVLTQPKSILLQCVAARSDPSGWGDLLSAAVLIGLSDYLTPVTLPLCLLAVVCGSLVLASSTVIVHSMAFWVADSAAVARQLSEFLLLFSLYPKTVFGGPLKLMLYTVVPAGFITFLPVDLVRSFSWSVLGAVVVGALAYASLAVWVFRSGLRRYESGSRFGVRA